MNKKIEMILGKFAFWREILFNEESNFQSSSTHVSKCGYCGS